MSITYGSVIPLIGGLDLGLSDVFESTPKYILSYSPFEANESHLLNYYKTVKNLEVPYVLLDKEQPKFDLKVDVISITCPCAGLSQYHNKYGVENLNNQWMDKSAHYILENIKPRVVVAENAPALVGKIGTPIRQNLIDIARKNGYSVTFYRTKNLLHGVPQVRERTFYFFWKNDKTPLLDYYDRKYTRIEDIILGVKSNFQMEPINQKIPTQDPYYRYLLEVVHGGITHRQHFDILDTTNIATRYLDAKSLIELSGHDYRKVGQWMKKEGYDKEEEKCERMYKKLNDGGNIMRRGTIVPKDYIGAFVGHYPTMLTHPHEDRYITYREAMAIMGLPSDYELLNPKKSYNHICQNVPYLSAFDMGTQIKKYLNGELDKINSNITYQYNNSKTHTTEENLGITEFFN